MRSAEPRDRAAPEEVSLDAEIAEFVRATAQSSNLNLGAMALAEALNFARPALDDTPLPVGCEDRWVDIGRARDIRVRLYFPTERNGALPVLMHLHGGGFVGGTVEMDDARCIAFAEQSQCLVASVDYPLAPEHRFPEAIEQAFSVWQWIGASATELGIDPGRMAVSGSSAGGHLAIGLCLLAREHGAPQPILQLLTYPVVDPKMDSGSYVDFANGPFLTRSRMAWYWEQYVGAAQPEGQLLSPLSGSLAGLPPALVITAQYDVLRDEGESYAKALDQAGVRASVFRHGGMIHGFLAVTPCHREAVSALAECTEALKHAFAGSAGKLGKGLEK